jgi:hypothetical protein
MDDKIIRLVKGKQYFEDLDLVLPTVLISKTLIKKTEEGLTTFPKEPNESVVYWAGERKDNELLVKEVIIPKASTSPISFRVNSFENARIMNDLMVKNMELLAQISTRPLGADLTISLSDNEMGFLPFEGMIYIFVANYALEGITPFSQKTAVYLVKGSQHVRFSKEQIQKFFEIN